MESKKRYRIGIDARFYGPLGKGLGRYTQETVDNVLAFDRENEYVIFLSKDNFDELVTDHPRVKKVLADVRWYTLAEQVRMPWLIAKEKLDLMHYPHFNVPLFSPVRFIVTIHDLILTKFPTMRATTLGPVLYLLKNLFYRIIIRHAIKGAEKVIAVTEYTKKDIMEQFGTRADHLEMIYEGVATLSGKADRHFSSTLKAEEILSDYCILEPYLLYVGNAYPHKNLETLIRVFKRFHENRRDLKLVLVGKDDYFYSRLKEYAEQEGLWSRDPRRAASLPVIFPGYVPDKELNVLFSRAAAYVFPSKYEGFGLPPLEAMSRNCPVVSSNATCLPEVLGEAALYFDPYDDEDILEKLELILTDEALRKALCAKGFEQIKLFSWEKAGEAVTRLYSRILSNA